MFLNKIFNRKAAVMAAGLLLAGCQTSQQDYQILGAVGGAVLGDQLTDGDTLGIAAGAIGGAVVGGIAGRTYADPCQYSSGGVVTNDSYSGRRETTQTRVQCEPRRGVAPGYRAPTFSGTQYPVAREPNYNGGYYEQPRYRQPRYSERPQYREQYVPPRPRPYTPPRRGELIGRAPY